MQTRVLHLFVSLPVGGAENLLLSVLQRLDADRFRSVVCCIGDKGIIGKRVEELGIPVIELGKLRRGGWDGSVVEDLLRVIGEQGIALLHSHLYHANFYGRLAARRAGIPCIASIHNTYTCPKWHRRLINRYLGRHTARFIAGSEEIRRDIVRYDGIDAAKIEVIANAIDLGRAESTLSREAARLRLGVAADAVVLGTIGRLEEQKGHRFLLQALALLAQRNLRPQLLLVGDGRLQQPLRDEARALGVDGQVQMLGTRDDLGDLLRAMDLFVMPSLWEGLSLAMLTAMAAGLPVIATDVGGVAQVLGENERGYRLAAGDAQALADRIAWCTEHRSEAAAMAETGARHVRSLYGDVAAVRRLESIYDEVLAQAAAASRD